MEAYESRLGPCTGRIFLIALCTSAECWGVLRPFACARACTTHIGVRLCVCVSTCLPARLPPSLPPTLTGQAHHTTHILRS
jgi:hypothetical protein